MSGWIHAPAALPSVPIQ